MLFVGPQLKKKSKFKNTAEALECEARAIGPLNEVWQLSRHFALHAIIGNYEPLLKYFEESDNDPISKYCKRGWKTTYTELLCMF